MRFHLQRKPVAHYHTGNDVAEHKLAGISNKQLFSFHSTIYYTVKFKRLLGKNTQAHKRGI